MQNYYRRMRPLLGTFVEIGISSNSINGESAVNAAFAKISEIQNLLSFHDPLSDLSKLNRSSGEWVELSSTSALVIRIARRMMVLTNDLFNCTVAAKMISIQRLPGSIDSETLLTGSSQDFEVKGRSVRLKRPVKLTLDGVAKGFAVDMAVKTLKKMNIRSGWVNAGGDLKVFGEIALPVLRRELDNNFSSLGTFRETALATSAIRDDFDPRYQGFIIAKDSFVIPSGSVTISSTFAWLADALTKVAPQLPSAKRQQVLSRFGSKFIAFQLDSSI